MSAACFCAEPCASVEMYLSPAASTTALIAASSVFQRSSWNVFQDTAMVLSLASATADRHSDMAAPARMADTNFLMISSLRRDGAYTGQ